jgi:hypothetical protein
MRPTSSVVESLIDHSKASTSGGRNGLLSVLARSANLGRGSALAREGNAGLKATAPKPAINSRRFGGKLALAMGQMRTIFSMKCLVAAVWSAKPKPAIFLLRTGRAML